MDEERFVQGERREEQLAAGLVPLDIAPRRPPLSCLAVGEPLAVRQLGPGLPSVARENLEALLEGTLDSCEGGSSFGVDSQLLFESAELLASLTQLGIDRNDISGKLAVVFAPFGPRPQPEDPGTALAHLLARLNPALPLFLVRPQCHCHPLAARDALIGILDTFVAAGWPEARRLTYGLPEIFR